MESEQRPVVFFDGVCAFCDRSVDFLMRHDGDKFLFAPLQGPTAKEKLPSLLCSSELRSLVLLDAEGIHVRSRAVLRICWTLGGLWRATAVLSLLPPNLLDAAYDYFASHRYQWFGKHETCRIPTPQERARFLD